MSSTAFIEPLPVIEFVQQLLNRDVSARPLSDADRVKVNFLFCNFYAHSFAAKFNRCVYALVLMHYVLLLLTD